MKKLPGRLHHATPGWVPSGSPFHIRLRAEEGFRLILDGNDDDAIARALIASARFYHEQQCWFCRLFLIMPDHIHAILAFPPSHRMSDTIQAWKRFHRRKHGIRWQEGYFDHRLRDAKEENECWHYIRQNPLRGGLVADESLWPWIWSGLDAAAPE